MSELLHTPIASSDVEILRAWLYTYSRDRLGRDAPVASRAAAHDALDRLARTATGGRS